MNPINISQNFTTKTLDYEQIFSLTEYNRTRIKTSTGIWNVTYNGENRPILFDDGMQSWAMEYDYMGRRISQSGRRKGSYDYSPLTNYLYNDYLLIEEHQFQPGPYGYDRTFGYLWDPIAGMASRPLMMLDYQNNSFFYTHDANKNITELVNDSGKIVTHYEYSPFGALTVSTASTANPFTFSSEYFDSSLGLIYYNYRHYNPLDGRWLSRDPIEEIGGYNLYGMVANDIINNNDFGGLTTTLTVVDNNGTTTTITLASQFTVLDLLRILNSLKTNGLKIAKIKIYGHGDTNFMTMNDSSNEGSVKITVSGGDILLYEFYDSSGETTISVDITQLLKDLLISDAEFDLCGCHTGCKEKRNLAQEISRILKGVTVIGSETYMFGDPWFGTEFEYRLINVYRYGRLVLDGTLQLLNNFLEAFCPMLSQE